MTTAIRLDPLPTLRASRRARPAGEPARAELHRATRNLRRHWARDVGRTVVLGMSDLGTVVAVRALVRVVRDHAVLGDGLSGLVNFLIPPGTLGGWHFAVALLLGLTITGAYGPAHRRRDGGRILAAVAVAALMILYGQAWEQSAAVVAWRLAAVIATAALGLVLSRTVMDALIGMVVPGVAPSHLVVVSDGSSDWIDPAILAHGNGTAPRFRIVATVATNGGSPSHALSQLPRVIDEAQADTVLIAGPLADRDFAFVADTALASGCRLLAAPRITRVAGVEPRAVWERGTSLTELTAPGLQAWHLAAKRVMDLGLSSLALVFLSPVFVIIAALVKLDSPGPALFGHWRLGARGKMFRCYKFRSMRQHAEQVLRADPRLYQLYVDNDYKLPPHLDPRVTRVGALLRKCSLDELPQLFNVFLGQMSLVGPRPIVAEELDHYGETAPLFLSRKPGITGNWAVNGRSDVGYPRRADLELAYMRQWSLFTDVGLMLRTIPEVARRRGAH